MYSVFLLFCFFVFIHLMTKIIPAVFHFIFIETGYIWQARYAFSRIERWGFIYMAAVAFFMDTTRQPGYGFLYWDYRMILLSVIYPIFYTIPWIIIAVRLFTISASYYLSRRFYADFTWEPSKAIVDGVIAWCGAHADSKLKFSQVRKPVKIISFFFDSMDYRAGLDNRPVKTDMDIKEKLDDLIHRKI